MDYTGAYNTIFGTMIYVFVNLQLGTKIMRSRLASIDKQLHEKAKTSDAVLEKLESELHGERGLASIYIMPVTFRHIMIMILSSFRLASSSLKR